jgi:DNA-directed RNA polymerase specialized sigma subunit
MQYIIKAGIDYNPQIGTFLGRLHRYGKYGVLNLKHKLSRKGKKKRVLSLSRNINKINRRTFADFHSKHDINPVERLQYKEIVDYIKISPYFTEREKIVLLGLYVDFMHKDEIAQEIGVHPNYIEVLRDKALEKLRWKFADDN